MNRLLAALALLMLGTAAQAQETPPLFGRYQPLYPGLYLTTAFGQDARDRSYDQNGDEQPTALPVLGGETQLPRERAEASFAWHFPLFQSRAWPLISNRPFTARVTLGYTRNRSDGALAAFAADTTDDAATEADALSNSGSGVIDLRAEFGTFLLGQPANAQGPATRYALLLSGGVILPLGAYNRDAPVNAGENQFGLLLKLGGHARLWPGSLLDAGYAWQGYTRNQDPAFGALEPAQRGDEQRWDLSLAQKLFTGVYLTAFATDRKGDPNRYDQPRFAPHPPEAESSGVQPADNYPTPGSYQDQGTALRSAGVSASWFFTQRWLAGLHYTQPLSGRSGEFTLPYTDREPAGCTVGTLGCETRAGGSTRVDGLGESRAYASPQWMFTLTYTFWQGDTYTCPGCEQ